MVALRDALARREAAGPEVHEEGAFPLGGLLDSARYKLVEHYLGAGTDQLWFARSVAEPDARFLVSTTIDNGFDPSVDASGLLQNADGLFTPRFVGTFDLAGDSAADDQNNKRPPLSIGQRGFHTLMEGKRIAGSKMIVPDDETKSQIAQLRVRKITGTFRLCLDEAGRVESVLPMTSTGFPAYDRNILAGIALWRYSSYTVDGEPVPVCTAVTFIYSQR